MSQEQIVRAAVPRYPRKVNFTTEKGHEPLNRSVSASYVMSAAENLSQTSNVLSRNKTKRDLAIEEHSKYS